MAKVEQRRSSFSDDPDYVLDRQDRLRLLLEVDPIALVRGKGRRDSGFSLAQYVNDRPYAASSMLAVALGKVFRTAMAGRCDARPELAAAKKYLAMK